MIGKIIGLIVFVVFIVWITGIHYLFTFHDRTLDVTNTNIDPGDKGSHYLVHGADGQIVELERMWFQWDANVDKVLNTVQQNEGKRITFECWGWEIDMFYWYSNCPKIKSISNVTDLPT